LGKITIHLNGNATQMKACNIQTLLDNNQLPSNLVIVEQNGTIVQHKDYENTWLNENDHIEIIRYIGGGKK